MDDLFDILCPLVGDQHILRTEPVPAGTVEDKNPSRRHDRGQGDQGLDGLVEIDVQRPARRGDNDIGPGRQGDLAEGPHELDRCQVSLDQIAGEDTNRLACLVQDQVDGEMDLQHPGRFDHVEMNRILLELSRTGLRRHQHLRPVVDLNGPFAGDPRKDRLPSP